VRPPSRAEEKRTGIALVFLVLFVSLQIFLLVVAVEGVLAHDARLARAAAVLSAGVFGAALLLRWFLRE
jgi:hypothetical protein